MQKKCGGLYKPPNVLIFTISMALCCLLQDRILPVAAFDDNMGLGDERLTSVPQQVIYYQPFKGLVPELHGLQNLTESYTEDLGVAGTMNFLWVTYRD